MMALPTRDHRLSRPFRLAAEMRKQLVNGVDAGIRDGSARDLGQREVRNARDFCEASPVTFLLLQPCGDVCDIDHV